MSVISFAQTPPGSQQDARELQRLQERERAVRERLEERPDVMLERRAGDFEYLPKEDKPCFVINEIILEGDSADKFAFAVSAANPSRDRALGKCLGTQGINIVMKRIQNRIIEKGFVTTRVLAAPQDLSTGKLTLTIIPGRVREVRFSEDTPDRATKWNAVPIKSGDILNLRDIEQALENLKRVPSADADFQILPAEGPGARPGDSDIIIQWTQGRPVRFSASIDDSGSRFTGRRQGNITVSLDNPFMLNDLFYASYGHDLGGGIDESKETKNYILHYEIPYEYWSLGFTVSSNDYYQTILGINENYRYSGSSYNHEVKLSRLIYRDAIRKSTVWLSGWHRTSKNHIDDVEIELQRRKMGGWEAGLNHKEFMGTSTADLTLSYKRGTGLFGAMEAPEEPFDEGTSRPKIINASVYLNMPFTIAGQRLSLTHQFRRQWNLTPLVPQDRFSIGGRYTVRGFDGEMTLMGDRGWLIRNDLGIVLGNTGQELYFAYDYGSVKGQSTAYLNRKHLAGTAIGVRGGYGEFYWDLFAGVPLAKPDEFQTMNVATGFYLGWSY